MRLTGAQEDHVAPRVASQDLFASMPQLHARSSLRTASIPENVELDMCAADLEDRDASGMGALSSPGSPQSCPQSWRFTKLLVVWPLLLLPAMRVWFVCDRAAVRDEVHACLRRSLEA